MHFLYSDPSLRQGQQLTCLLCPSLSTTLLLCDWSVEVQQKEMTALMWQRMMHYQCVCLSPGQSWSPFTDHPSLRKPCLTYFKANICPYYRCLWCNETDKIILSHSLIRRHSLLVCCNSLPLFCSCSCLSSCLPLFHDCFAGHDDIPLKMRRKGRIRPVQSLASVASAATTGCFMIFPFFIYNPLL